ncbi:hypothetical protein CWI39_3691p0010, partial [Hamiltosporidium magnivora]
LEWIILLVLVLAFCLRWNILDQEFPLKTIFIKYYIIAFLLSLSDLLNPFNSDNNRRYNKYDLTTLVLIYSSIISEILIHKLNFSSLWNFDSKAKAIYAILNILSYLFVSFRYNNWNFIQKKVSFELFLEFCSFIFVMISVNNIFAKVFYITIADLVLFKSLSYVFVIIITFIYLIRKNSFKQSFLLCMYYSLLLFSLELKNIQALHNINEE